METQRRFAFSLRTVFVLLTALAVWLGHAVNRAREQREAVEAIEALGGDVHYDWQDASAYRSSDVCTLKPVSWGAAGSARNGLDRIVGDDLRHKVDRVVLRVGAGQLRIKPGNVVVAEFEPEEPDVDIRLAISHLKRLRGLQQVLVESHPRLRDAAVTEIAQALPDCEIIVVAPHLEVAQSILPSAD